MHRYLRSITWGITLLVAIAAHRGALAQGVTGSAVTGTVTDDAGQPVERAVVQLRNEANGLTFTAVTGPSGDYFLDNVPAGGPYTLTAKATGYQPSTEQGLQLTLGQRLAQDLTVRSLGEEIVVVGRARTALDDRGRMGQSTTLKDSKINELPLQGRNFTDLIATAPGVTRESGGVSIAGQNNRYNNIQIDGGANNDLFGLAASGTPGGTTLTSGWARPWNATLAISARLSPYPPMARRARTSSKGLTRMFRNPIVGDISGPVRMVMPGLFSSKSTCCIGTPTRKSTSPERSEALAVRGSFMMRNSSVSRYGSPGLK